jgi:hypothetical protein
LSKTLHKLSKIDPFSQEQMLKSLHPLWATEGRRYRKCRNILAKRAQGGEKIETITADGLETVNTAAAGDFIIQNQTEAKEQYILGAEKFEKKYKYIGLSAQQGWQEYQPSGEILALELTAKMLETLQLPREFKFIARWGETMVAKKGDFLAMPAGGREIYRIAHKEFLETYAEI